MSTTEKTLQPLSVFEIVSKLGGLKSSLSMAWFRSVGSKHSFRVLFAFSTITKLLTQSTGSSTLVIISLLSISSRVALSLSLNLRGTFLCGWMVDWLLTFSLMVYSPSTHPKPSKPSRNSFKIAGFCWTSLILGSLRIEDFHTTPSLGHVIVLRCRPVEIWIHDS